ncbi:protease modulator HflC [Alsobacter sp. SYSU M60028]|uniref:Protein HflC n=1 Tax=Alsobacter ponti TaxID=2962936 RepID=A0ABT1L8D1_9HYPH|nr:protease modulator HflC [Alsobacter ponti]MCP8937206.1 protease modulator HflC [Alsobacter ponti]
MSSTLRFALGAVVLAALVVLFSAMFVVPQTAQALVFQFGRVARPPITQPGLYFKWPLIENVIEIDKRILDLELPSQEVIASDQKRLVVDAFTRYRVVDPLRFYQSVNNVAGANMRLTSIVNSTVRTVLAEANFATVVRTDRAGLMQRIRDDVNRQATGLGIEVVDVRLRRADLPEQNSQAVFQRMQTERQREAADIRAQGSQLSQTIRAKADREVTVLRADATRRADELRGQGEAERNRITAEAFGRDPEFFGFYRSMQAYEASLRGSDTRLLLSPDSSFFRYFAAPYEAKEQQRLPTKAPAPAPGAQAPSVQPGGTTGSTAAATPPAPAEAPKP